MIEGKTALVTGAGGGIGRATARSLANAGANVAIAELDLQKLEQTVGELRSDDRRVLPIPVDIGDIASIDAMIEEIVGEFGRIDIAVNNAGVTRHGGLLDITEETWDLMQNVNAKGTFFCMQRVARQMVDLGEGGRIINISSIGGKGFKNTSSPAYAASKGAVNSMTYIAAVQLAPYDINVNAICPGSVDTELLRGMLAERSADTGTPAETLLDGLRQMVPLGRLDEPEDIAAVAVFLAGPGGRNITGQTINLGGGLLMS